MVNIMFQNFKYKDGYIFISIIDGIVTIKASLYKRSHDSSGVIWDYSEKCCKSIKAAKAWISLNV